ncbi:hypothetical protein M3Y97_00046700 [Aphelenchoides bicaudatus]|nr:hypothetical protein M3Y97_00046700 [Aphelenchoides bicaudatus]
MGPRSEAFTLTRKANDPSKKVDPDAIKNYSADKKTDTLPGEVLISVFYYLPRNDLYNCSITCKRWKSIIDRYKASLARHQLDCVKFTSLGGEWKALIEFGYLCNFLRNKFKDPDEQYYGIPSEPDQIVSSCYKDVYFPISSIECLQLHFNKLLNNEEAKFCAQPAKPFFWKWLQWKLKDSTSQQIIFFDAYIDQDFIDGFSTILSSINDKIPYYVKQLSFHGVHFSNVSVNSLHKLLFEQFNAEEYMFSCVSGCGSDELNFSNISNYKSVQQARKLHLFGIRGEMACLNFDGPTDEQLLDILLSNRETFSNMMSFQIQGFSLTGRFIDKYLSLLRSDPDIVAVQDVYIDDLPYQRLSRDTWVSLDSKSKQLKRSINDYFLCVTHGPHRTTIFAKNCCR